MGHGLGTRPICFMSLVLSFGKSVRGVIRKDANGGEAMCGHECVEQQVLVSGGEHFVSPHIAPIIIPLNILISTLYTQI